MKMKRLILYSALHTLLVISFTFAQTSESAEVTFFLGEVNYQNAGEQTWKNVELHQAIKPGNILCTETESRCELYFNNKDVARFGENTRGRIALENKQIVVYLDSGNVWINACKNGNERIRVHTPTAVAAIRGTVYRITTTPFFSRMVIFQGVVMVNPFDREKHEPLEKSFVLNPGKQITIVSDFEKYRQYLETEYQNYIKREKDEFRRFLLQQQEQFNDYVKEMEKGFEEFKSVKIKTEKYNMEEEIKSDWVKWNLERDKKINR